MKKLLILIATLTMVMNFVGCSNQTGKVDEETKNEAIVSKEQSFMEEYIRSIDSSKRDSFLLFSESTRGFCQRLESKLSTVEFTGEYEFNPSKMEEVPQEIEEICSFQEFSLFPEIYKFEDIKMSIKDATVRLSYDGKEFYPTTYSYTDIKDIIEKVNAE